MTRRLLVIAISLAGAGLIATACWLSWALKRPGPAQAIDLEVAPGTATNAALDELHRRGVLPSVLAARLYIAVCGHGRALHFGRYRLAPASQPVEVLERLLDGRVEMITVTVVEGSTATAVAERMVAAGIGTMADWDRLVTRRDWIADLAPDAPSLEGFLYPDTYRFAVAISGERAAHHMVQRFRQVWTREVAAMGVTWGSTLEVVTLASLIEGETSVAGERARIAGVFVNRLRRGMLLQCDPTVVYALKRRLLWTGRLLRQHWQLDDPYNTYRYPGLPPGPINSPGRASISAALDPEEHAYLYFVARPQGGHTFSETLREHNRAVARLQRSRR